METITIEYISSVKTPAGFRGVKIKATAEKISAKRVKVKQVLMIDEELPMPSMSRTGANRQAFSGTYVCNNETGKTKNISTLISISN